MARILFTLTAFAALAACSGGPSASCDRAAVVKLSDIQASVFTPSCATSSCHAGARPSQKLSLEDGKTLAAVVGVPSRLDGTHQLVKPGDPASSELFLEMDDGRMPQNASKLTDAQIIQVRDWICGGAQP
jgi:hypothetical protein